MPSVPMTAPSSGGDEDGSTATKSTRPAESPAPAHVPTSTNEPCSPPSTAPPVKATEDSVAAVGSSTTAAACSVPAPAPAAKPLTVGLINEGSTCYLNSLLQLLFHINYFRTAVYRIPPDADTTQKTLCAALQELFFEMQERTTPARTRALTTSFGWGEEELLVQHDIQEMATLLRDTLEEKMKGTEAEGTIHQLFEGRGEQVVETLDHSYVSRRPDIFYDIHLPLANHHTLIDSLRSLTVKDQLVGDDKYRVEEEGKPPIYKDAEKGLQFRRFAPVTWFHLKRFDMDLTSPTLEMKKVNSALAFPLVLDLQSLETDGEDSGSVGGAESRAASPSPGSPLRAPSPAIYDLHGVIVHRGTVDSGHYYCYIRTWDNEKQAFTHWVEYEDETVRVVSEEVAVSGNYGGSPGAGRQRFADMRASSASAYVLSYVRRACAPILLAPCPTDIVAQSVKDALRKTIEEEERRLRQAETARQQLTVYVLTEASLSACTLDRTTALLPSELSQLRRYAEATLELKKSTPLRVAYEQLDELLLTPCGLPVELCRLWRISGGPPTPPTQPGAGLAYTVSASTSGSRQGTNSGGAAGSAATSSRAGSGGVMAGERSSLNVRELHVGRALPTWRETCDADGAQEALLLQDFLTPAERQKSNILGLFLQGPLLPTLSAAPLFPVATAPSVSSQTEADAASSSTIATTAVVATGARSLVSSFTVASTNAVAELILVAPTAIDAVTAVIAHTASTIRSCTMTVQLYTSNHTVVGRYQEMIVVDTEVMRVTWRLPKGGAPAAAREPPPPAEEGNAKLAAAYTGPVSCIKFQVTNTHTGKPIPILDAHLHIPPSQLSLTDRVDAMALAEPGQDRVLLFFKLFDHTLGAVRYLGEGVLDRALTPRHCEDWLLRLAGAELSGRVAPPPSTRPPPLRLRFFEETRGAIARELNPDGDWMDNLVYSGSTIVVQRACVPPVYRHLLVQSLHATLQSKALVRVVEVASVRLDVESQYRAQLDHHVALRRSLPDRKQAIASAVAAFTEHQKAAREKKKLEAGRLTESTAPTDATHTATTPQIEASGQAPTSSKRGSQTLTRVDADPDLNPFHSSLPTLQQTVLEVREQAMCPMLLTWCYDTICNAVADRFMVTPGSIRLYQSRDEEGTKPQAAPAPTTATLEELLKLDAYTSLNALFFERLAVPRVLADQYTAFKVTLRDAEGHALHSERYSLSHAESTRQGLVRAVRQSITDWEREVDAWGTLEETLNAPQYTLLVISEEAHVIQVIKEVRLSGRDGAPYTPETALDVAWQRYHLVLIPLGPLSRGEERIACCHGEYRNNEVLPFDLPFIITVDETTTVTQAVEKMLACTHIPMEAVHRENHYAAMMLTERACYFSDWDETIVMYWRCTQNTSDHVPALVLNYSNPLDKPGSRYVAHHEQRLKITK